VERIIKVEDTHGVDFHRELVEKLKERGVLSSSLRNPRIERLDTGKCNPKMVRTILARMSRIDRLKVLFLIDSEGRAGVAYNDILQHFVKHFKKKPEAKRLDVKVVVVEPKHEAWLCIGLGGDKRKCRNNPEEVISGIKNDEYKKERLSGWARDIEINYLLNESDFEEYIQGVKWLLEDH
jgi:hypothetical protein